MPLHFSDQLTISDAIFDATAQTLTVRATSSDATVGQDGITPIQTLTVPGFGNLTNGQLVVGQVLAVPATIAVTSSGGGANTRQVTTGVPSASGGGTTPTTPPTQPVAPIATNVAAATIENQSTTFTLTTDPTMTVALVTNPVRAPRRAEATAASVPACPAPTTSTSNSASNVEDRTAMPIR